MILQPATVYKNSGNRPGIHWLLKNGVFQNDHDVSECTFGTGGTQYGTPSYVTDLYFQIPHNNNGTIKFSFSAPRKYMYIKVISYQYTTATNYRLNPINNNTNLGGGNWIGKNGSAYTVTPAQCSTAIQLRVTPVLTGVIGIANYFGGYHITDVWFSDYTYDFIL